MLTRVLTALALIGILFGAFATSANASTIHRSAWGKVIVRCQHSNRCEYVSAAIRADLGIGHRPARMFVGDTTVIYVKYSANHVRKFVS